MFISDICLVHKCESSPACDALRSFKPYFQNSPGMRFVSSIEYSVVTR